MTTRRPIASIVLALFLIAACGGPSADDGGDGKPPLGTAQQSLATSGASYTFPVGSLIIPMDTDYQDNGMFLAYGLVYNLLQQGIPVSWVIKKDKRLSTIVTATRVGTTATFTTKEAHNLVVGEPIRVRDVSNNTYNGLWTVVTVPAATTFTVTLAATPNGNATGGTATPSDFIASATDRQGGPAITNHGYRGGPFVIDAAHVAAANPYVTAWQTANPTTKVHTTTAAFTGYVRRQLVAAPTIAQFDDGNADIAAAYLNAAKIPDSVGGTWTATSPDLLSEAEVAGTSCPGTGDCIATAHNDGALFDGNGAPAYCQMMSMHWAINDADDHQGREVVREYRSFLQFPVHLFAECQGVNAIENNQNAAVTITASPNGATRVATTATFTTATPHFLAVGMTVQVAGVANAAYNGKWIVVTVPTATTFTVTLASTPSGNSGGGTVRSYNGLFLTRTGYLIGARPADVDSHDYDQPFAQYDGPFNTTGGSEPAYSIPAEAGAGYKAMDVVMLTSRANAAGVIGVNDLWMTGFLDGQCSTTQEFCDPSFAQGKVSYLGGHNYQTDLPLSSGSSQGARLFLNALLEAPCATDLGVASVNLVKSAPATTNVNSATYTITAFNNGSSVAGSVTVTDTLAAGVSFVPAASQRLIVAGTGASRAANVVTITTTAAHPYVVGDRVIVTGVTSAAFDGTFIVTAVPSATSFRYAQTGPNATSGGGRVARGSDGVCIGTAAQCTGSGGGVVTFALGALGAGQTTAVSFGVTFGAAAVYTNIAQAGYRAGTTQLTATSNSTSTCYYAGNPAICGGGGDPNAPACGNGTDDDGDGLIDFPDDPGCHSLTGTTEVDQPAGTAVKSRVLIVFDTSGSMMWNTCANEFTGGDGSLACPGADVACAACGTSGCGNGVADDSRIRKVKTGITNVVNGFGEVEWGLMRFKQLPVAFSCGTSNVNRNDGGWQGAGASPCAGFNAGELMVEFDPESSNDLLRWMDGSSNYAGTPPIGKDFELRASGNTPLAGSLSTAQSYIAATRSGDLPQVASCRPYRVILVTDGAETCAGDPVARAASLFASGDPDGQVPVHVIGFSTPDPTTQAQLDQIAQAGGTSTYVPADDEAQLSAAVEAIVQGSILVELCNSLDDDCDARVDEDFPDKGASCTNGARGACLRAGTRVCTSDQRGTTCNAQTVTCTGGRLLVNGVDSGPCSETCNDADDDCDGAIDEGLTGCNCQALPEICNGLDDDCDGTADDGSLPGVGDACGIGIGACTLGTTACVGGQLQCSAPQPMPEACNNIDDDCDTFTDEGSSICYPSTGTDAGMGCRFAGGVWTCTGLCRTGVQVCSGGMPGACTGATVGVAERCNGQDDDCDGMIDELWPDLGDPCNNGQQGACAATGTLVCDPADVTTPGHYVCTAPTITPGVEVCNGQDDNCNGVIDDNLPSPPFGAACGGSACGGVLACSPQGMVVCTGQTCNTPGCVELCNGEDDDCDTIVDEGATTDTSGNTTCTDCCVDACCRFDAQGNCLEDCTVYQDIGECDFGNLVCQAGGLHCTGYVGPRPEICDGLDNNCDGVADEGAMCTGSAVCQGGECVLPCSQTEFPCPAGFVCRDVPNCGQPECRFCFTDPCATVTCPAGEQCDSDDGMCHDVCAGVMCPTGTRCSGGICQDCTTLGCAANELCVRGSNGISECQPDLCAGVTCGAGEFCNAGTCTPLGCTPACPADQVCFNGQCVGNACGDVTCASGRICDPDTGTCVDDPCAPVSCGRDQICNPDTGNCIPDPCLQVDCPAGTACENTPRGTTCTDIDEPGFDVTAAGGGGCCGVGSAPDTLSMVLVLGGLLATRRRRVRKGRRPIPRQRESSLANGTSPSRTL